MQPKPYIKEEELNYLRKRYSEDDIKALRRCLFSTVTEEDRQRFGDKENIRILKKLFIPEYDINGEIFDNPDTINRVEPLGFDFEVLSVVMKAQIYSKELINNTFEALLGNQAGLQPGSALNLVMTNDVKTNAQNIFNRSTLLRIVNGGLQGLYTIANSKTETPEEKTAKKIKDSSK